jgi:omega-6 fatty acid desaturase (delta-12 desaturase)
MAGWLLMMQLLGAGLFWISYSTVMMFSAAIMICIFFVQHNFEGSYAHTTDDWDECKGAIEGSSYLKMPALLNWFSADIGYHNIHHLCEAIPNYNLRDCHEANLTQLSAIKILTLKNIPSCFRYILWNREFQRLEALP